MTAFLQSGLPKYGVERQPKANVCIGPVTALGKRQGKTILHKFAGNPAF